MKDEYSKVAQALEKVFPLMRGKEYYLSSEEFSVAFKALADTIKALRTENRDTSAYSLKQIEELVSQVISTHSKIEAKADKSINLSDKVLADYKKTIDSLNAELSSFKKDIQNKIDSIKDGEDARPEDVVPLVLKEIKFPEPILDEAPEIKDKLESLKGDERLDSSAIKNLPEIIRAGVNGVRTKVFTDGTTITGNGTLSDPLVAAGDGTQTLTNKRINPRLVTAASYTTDTGTSLDVSTCDQFEVTAQAGPLKLNNPGGTPTGGQKLIVRIKDDGTAIALTYDTQFRAMGVALPSTTVLSKTLYLGLIFNATDTKWDLIAAAQEE